MRVCDGVYLRVLLAGGTENLTEWALGEDRVEKEGVPRRKRIIPWRYDQYIHIELEDWNRPHISDFVVIRWDGEEVLRDVIIPRPRANGFKDEHYKHIAVQVDFQYGDFGQGKQRFRMPSKPERGSVDSGIIGGTIEIEVWSKKKDVRGRTNARTGRRTSQQTTGTREQMKNAVLRATAVYKYRTHEWRNRRKCVSDDEIASSPEHSSSSSTSEDEVEMSLHVPYPTPSSESLSPRTTLRHSQGVFHPSKEFAGFTASQLRHNPVALSSSGSASATAIPAELSRGPSISSHLGSNTIPDDVSRILPSKAKSKVHPIVKKENMAGIIDQPSIHHPNTVEDETDDEDLSYQLRLLERKRGLIENKIHGNFVTLEYHREMGSEPHLDIRIERLRLEQELLQNEIDQKNVERKIRELSTPSTASEKLQFELTITRLNNSIIEKQIEEDELAESIRKANKRRRSELDDEGRHERPVPPREVIVID